MIIYRPNGTPLFEVDVDDSSYRYRSIMRSDELTLMFSLAIHVELPIGAYCTFEGDTYTLLSLANVTVRHRRNYEYRITMYSPMERLKNYIIFNPVEGDERLRFDITVNPREHLDLIIANINHREGLVWSAGCYIEGEPRTISYNMTTAWDALVQLANAFNTEFEVAGTSIRLGKVEYNKSNPLALSYGQGNGLRPGVARLDAQMPIEKVYVQGGNRNIGLDNYDAKTLHLPSMVSFYFNGSNFSQSGVAMQTNDSGTCLFLTGASSYAVEASLDLSDIYPHREGVVSGLVFAYKGNFFDTLGGLNIAYPDLTPQDWYDVVVYFYDNTLPENLDFAMYEMGQEPESVIFQTGNLAGREFNVKFSKAPIVKTLYDDITGETVEVEVVPANNFKMDHATIDGTDMPAPAYLPVPTSGEVVTYGIFNCSLPAAYIRNDPDKTGAEWEMAREAARFLYENKDPKVSYRGELDPLYAKSQWLTIGGKILCGGFVRFTDPSVQATPLDVRITGVRQYVNNPYAPVIEFGNEAIVPSMTNVIKTIDAKEAKIESMIAAVRRFSGRSFADAKETAQMLIDLGLENFTEAISPIVIQTMQLIAGDESLQFQFIRSLTDDTVVGDPVHMFDPDTKTLTIDHSFIKHLTIGITDITAPGSRDPSEYKRWEMARYVSPVLSDPSKKYYIYAMVSESSPTGVYTLSENPIAFKRYTIIEGQQVLAGYSLLVGILTSERDGYRSYGPVYGFTEILPGQITTEVIRSSDGQAFFDLTQRIFQLGDKFVYSPQGGLVLKNALTVNGDGNTVVLGSWCGEWNDEQTYALGDEVWWEAPDGTVSTYRYINDTPSIGHLPSDDNYWQFSAKGVKGQDGAYKSTAFIRTNDDMASAANTPTGGTFSSPIPTSTHTDTSSGAVLSWSDGIPAGDTQLWASTCVFRADGTNDGWTMPRAITDTADIDYEFSAIETNPGTPTSNPSGWHNTATASDIWMAVRKCSNGVWGNWDIIKVKGEDGEDGDDGRGIVSVEETGWNPNGLNSTTPPSSGWVRPPSAKPAQVLGKYFWTETTTTYTSGSPTVIYTATYCAENGVDGSNGIPGPSSPYRGTFSDREVYYATSKRCDVVYYNGAFYQAIYDGTDRVFGRGTTEGVKYPNNSLYWTSFESNYSNIATGLLFASLAIIENLGVRVLETDTSSSGNPRIVIMDNVLSMRDRYDDEKLRVHGGTLSEAGSVQTFTFGSSVSARSAASYSTNNTVDFSTPISMNDHSTNLTIGGSGQYAIKSGATLIFPSITVDLSAYVGNVLSGPGTYAMVTFTYGWLLDGVLVSSDYTSIQLTPSNTSYINQPGSGGGIQFDSFTVPISANNHTVSLYGEIEISGDLIATGWGFEIKADASKAFYVTYPEELTEIASNGFQVRFGSLQMLRCEVNGNTTTFEIRADNYGLKVTNSGIQISTNGTYKTLTEDNGFLKVS